MNDAQQQPDLQQQTFVDTVLKIIGPKIVAEFVTHAWEVLPDEQKQIVVTAIGKQVTEQITNNAAWTFRSLIEHKINDVARQATDELVVVNYDSILDRVHKTFKDVVDGQVKQICNDIVKSALEAVKERLNRDLNDIVYNRKFTK